MKSFGTTVIRRVYCSPDALGIRSAVVLIGRTHERIAEQVKFGNRILSSMSTVPSVPNFSARQSNPRRQTGRSALPVPPHTTENRVDMSIHVHRQHLSLAGPGGASSRLPCS